MLKSTESKEKSRRRGSSLELLVGEFHTHIDAQTLSTAFERFLIERRQFCYADFSGHPEGSAHCPPKKHLTRKTKSVQDFRSTFDALVGYLKEDNDAIEGYIEAEYIPIDIDIESNPFNPSVKIPLKINLTSLPPGTFRQSEMHITLLRDKSDPRLINSLTKMGFYSVYMSKAFGEVEIFTAQGTRQIIRQVLPEVITYLRAAGGAVSCSVKEERIIWWWTSSPEFILPEVINFIEI